MRNFTFILTIALLLAGGLSAHDHPEGVTFAAQEASNTINAYSLARSIKNYVQKEQGMRGGRFTFFDAKENKPLALSLKKVHNDKLCYLGNESYFACADFSTDTGKIYDLDIFMHGKDIKGLKPVQVLLHKEGDQARYDWVKEKDIWKRVPPDNSKTTSDKNKLTDKNGR